MENITTFEMAERKLFSSNDSMAVQIKESLEKYKDLGMKEALYRAKEGAVAFVLEKMNLNLLKVTQWLGDGIRGENGKWFYMMRNRYSVNLVKPDGNVVPVSWDENNQRPWGICKLKDYTRPIPFEILNDLPKTAGEEAHVFYPLREAKDPIIAYLLRHNKYSPTKQIEEWTYRIKFWTNEIVYLPAGKQHTVIDNPISYWAAAYKWD